MIVIHIIYDKIFTVIISLKKTSLLEQRKSDKYYESN